MPSPTQSGTASNIALSSDNAIDSLVYGVKWGGVLGSGATISYSFPTSFSNGVNGFWDPNSYSSSLSSEISSSNHPHGLSTSQQAQFRLALQQWSNVANVVFQQQPESSTSVGDIRVAFSDEVDHQGAAAWAYLPVENTGQSPYPYGGDIWYAPSQITSMLPGAYDFMAAVHELGHALGLKHPFDGDNQFEASGAPTLPAAEDDWLHTVMSYSALHGNERTDLAFHPTSVMSDDIAAIQYLYGPNLSYHAGDDNYAFAEGQKYLQTIWDGGGNDTISYSSVADAAFIDLRPGNWSNLGANIQGYTWIGNNRVPNFTVSNDIQIYKTVVIENATGGGGADTIVGNDVANSLAGNAGNDSMLGGLGNDTLLGGDGGDTLAGNQGDDTLLGGAGNDYYLHGGQGNDVVSGNQGDDTLHGGAGDDTLYGGQGNDWVDGGAGNDVLQGNLGNDTLAGGADADQFWFGNFGTSNADVIMDFVDGVDSLGLSSAAFTALAAVSGHLDPAQFEQAVLANSAIHFVLYNAATGNLYYDDDGSGPHAAALVAVLDNHASLQAADILLG
jgi:serralysin